MFRVTAPLVYLKVPDIAGSFVSYTFYKDAVVPAGVEQECLQRHLDEGMVEEVPESEPSSDDESPRRTRSRKSE